MLSVPCSVFRVPCSMFHVQFSVQNKPKLEEFLADELGGWNFAAPGSRFFGFIICSIDMGYVSILSFF